MHRRTKTASRWIAVLALGIGTLGISGQKALAHEKGLVGVRVGRTALEVLRVYGNPTRVQLDYSSPDASTVATTPGATAVSTPGAPVGGGVPGMLPPGMPVEGGVAPMPVAGPPGMPTMPGMPPGMPGMEGAPTPQTSGGSAQPEGVRQSVIWTYELPKARTLDVYVDSDGSVEQVRVSGFVWTNVKTAKGITLGDAYKKVLAKYGFPNSHERRGGLWLAHYTDPDNITFVFDSKRLKVVAISVFRPS